MKNINPLYLLENNQTITHSKKTAREFSRLYYKSGKKLNDSSNGIYHIYRTIKDKDGNSKVKRIKKEMPKDDESNK